MKDETCASIRPQDLQVPREALSLIARNMAERYCVCPLNVADSKNGVRTLAVAAVDPANLMLLDQLQQLTSCRIKLVQANEQDIQRGIEIHYGGNYTSAPRDLLQEMVKDSDASATLREQIMAQPQQADTRGAVGTVNNIFQRAIAERATDIHIEPHQQQVFVRFRVDGIMYDQDTLHYPPDQHPQVISRIKILAKLDIAQNRLPQDGRFEIELPKPYDVRISIVPAADGEKAVMRLLPKSHGAMDFDQLGITGTNRTYLEELITKPFGMVLVTGPTGSGKTTTLYTCLARTDCVGKNVITVEDPIEYQFPRITQIQVHPKIGLTFAAGLRAILRQDPDIIMVGEIRDLDTLQISMQSALTGHLVLSTLHCNDAASGAARMVDMGAEPFLVASSLNGIVAQRLVRKICEHCREPLALTDEMREKFDVTDETTFYHGRGCDQCRDTGYSGRLCVCEVIPAVDELQNAIVRKASASEIRNITRELGYTGLREDGLEKARAGITSIEEVLRAVYVDTL